MSTIGLVVSYSHIVEAGVGGGASTLNRDLTPVPPKSRGNEGDGGGEWGEERRTKQGEGRGTGGGTGGIFWGRNGL